MARPALVVVYDDREVLVPGARPRPATVRRRSRCRGRYLLHGRPGRARRRMNSDAGGVWLAEQARGFSTSTTGVKTIVALDVPADAFSSPSHVCLGRRHEIDEPDPVRARGSDDLTGRDVPCDGDIALGVMCSAPNRL